jgi:acyl-[acyl-carrier-protein]-phospholipid O-acyltransferase/long-chain-fatty-acid--[acyl-carrier-protein] ligase
VLEPPEEGWHDTGDIVTTDEQGFISIKGRAKRFAKIGGEVISLVAVEVLAAELWPNDPSAVIAVPDLRKGERLILVTQKKDATRPEFQAFAKARHASDLMIPAEVWVLDKLPVLGTGKADMMSLGKLVHERIAEKAQAQPEAMARATVMAAARRGGYGSSA